MRNSSSLSKTGVVVAALLMVFVLSVFAGGTKEGAQKQVTVTVTSWRTDDITAMNAINAAFMKKYPNITVKFDPIKNTEYAAQLQTALETKSDRYDVLGLFPFSWVETYAKNGYTQPLDGLVKNLSNLPKAVLAKYSSGGSVMAVPVAAVVHGIYYNKDIFAKYNLTEPKTWAEFITLCDTLKQKGENVIAQGAVDKWTLGEGGFSNWGANFYGGEASRQALMAGTVKFTDARFVKTFAVLQSLMKYFVSGYQSIDYVSMQQMFKTGQAAMMICGGSWEIGGFKAAGVNFGWFAPPVQNAGDKVQLCFLSDLGYGLSKYSKNTEAAATYLNWVSSPDFAQLFMTNIPGFYSYMPGNFTLEPAATSILKAVQGSVLVERLMAEKMSDQAPAGTDLLNDACVKVVLGEFTPEQAADYVQKGLEGWYKFK
jgi:raffinose/stachyose/melibiose transport system substrate-binding protein